MSHPLKTSAVRSTHIAVDPGAGWCGLGAARRVVAPALAGILLLLSVAGGTAHAQTPYLLWTGQTAAQTQIDTNHKSIWYINVLSSTVLFGGGNFTMKKGSSATDTVTLTLYQGSNTSGTVLGSVTKAASAFTGQFNPVSFPFASNVTLTPGTYLAVLSSSSPDQQSQAFFIKGYDNAIISLDGTTAISSTIATVSVSPTSSNISLSKSATATVQTNGTITYTIGLGNDGGSPSGTSATVKDQLPAGVRATAVAAGTGVSSVNCGTLPSTTGALLTCSVTLSSALASAAAPGTAAFTITATAPASAGSVTNYASVDPGGGSSPATPGASCVTTSCGSASTTVNTPSNVTLAKSATGTVLTNGTITYTLSLGNSGGTASGTSLTVKDQLPTGVVATAATAGSGVSSANCGTLPSSSGALLTCSVTLTSGLAAGASNGTAAFTLTATAPSSSGSITNYASVDPSGGSSPATPGASCATTSCGSASTTVNTPSDVTLSKAATSSVVTNGTITYTLNLGNSGGTTSGTSLTVKDQLPTGVVVTAATAGTGVSAVNCGSLPSSSGALLTCSVTLTSGLAAGASNGAAAFTLTATAPGSTGSITNYASVDPSGGSSPATPGASCATTSCGSASTTVGTPTNVTLSKSATGTVLTSGTITYTLGLGNSGGTTSGTSLTVKDQLPTGVVVTAVTAGTGVSAVNCGSLPSSSGALLTCSVTLTSGLAAGASNGTAAFTLTATAPSSSGSITNYASVDSTGGSSPATPGASCATTSCGSASTTVNTPVNVTLAKSATGTVLTNGTITYTLNLGNSGGTVSGTSLTVKDQLPTGVVVTAATAATGVSSVNCGTLPSSSGALLSCSVTLTGGLAGGASNGSAALTLTATAPSSIGSITNYASVDPTGGSSPAAPGASCATTSCGSATTSVVTPSNLTLTKSATASVVPNGTITYTFGLGNSGGSTSGTSATLKDQLPAGVVATAASVGTGVSAINCGTLPSASGALLTCTVTLSSGISAGAVDGAAVFTLTATAPSSSGSVTNYASVDPTGGSSPATPGASCGTSSCDSAVTSVATPSNLTLSKSAPATVLTSGSVTYTLGLGNSGGTTSGTSLTVKDQLPTGMVVTAATAGTGVSAVNCGTLPSSSGALLTCTVTLTGGLEAGASNGTAAFTLTATAPSSSGSITNYASVDPTGGSSPATPGASCATTSCGSASTTVNTPVNVTLAKSATGTVLTNGTITYTLGLGNSGGTASGTSVTVKDQLPTGVVVTAATAGTGVSAVNCGSLPSSSGALLTCAVTLTSGLAAGASNGTAAFTLTATAPASSGSITNYASVDPAGGSSPATPGASCATTSCGSAGTTVNTPVNMTLAKSATGNVLASGTITYTLNLGNSGGTASGTSVTVKDQMPTGVVATAATAGTGVSSVDCGALPSSSGALLTCSVTLTSGLAAGASNGTAAFTLTATAPASGGSITNYASVDPTGGSSPATPGASCATTSCGSASTTVGTASNITLAKSATGTVLTSGTISYTLGLGNSGGTTSSTSVTVKDQLPTGVVATAATAGTGVSSVDCGSLPSASGALLTCSVTLNSGLAAGASNGTAAFTLTATAPSSSGSITNYASVDPTGGSSPATPGASCATTSCGSASTTVNTPVNVTLAKSATGTVLTNGTITYTLGLGNSGGTTSGTSVTVKDQLPTGVVATAATAGAGVSSVNCGSLPSASGALLTCSVTLTSGLAAGASNGTAAFTLAATAPASSGSITNYASVDPTGGSSPATPGASCATTSCGSAGTTVNTPVNVTLAKAATSAVTTSGTITYTLNLGNSGGTASGTSLTVKDQLPTGVVATAATAGTGVSSVNCGTLPSASGALLTCSVTLTSGLAAGTSNGTAAFTLTATAPASSGSITNYASVDPTGGSSPATPGASCATTSCGSASTSVSTGTNVTLSKTGTTTVLRGGTISYTLGLGNSGGTVSGTTVTVKDQLPAGVVVTAATAGTGVSSVNCGTLPSASGAMLTCTVTLTSGLAAGASNGAAAFILTATAPASSGSITNYASVDPTGGGSPATPGASCGTTSCASATTAVAAPAAFTVSKSGPATVVAGTAITYSLGIGNNGGTTSGTSVTVSDQLPDGMRATAAVPGAGVSAVTCSNLNSVSALVVCAVTLTSGLPSGAANGTAVFMLTAVAPSATGSITNYASVNPGGNGGPATPGPSCGTSNCASTGTTVQPGALPADLTPHITHEGVFTRLQPEAVFAVDVQNLGPSPSSGVVRLTLTVPAGLNVLSAAGAGWTCAIQGGNVECTRSDALAVTQKYPLELRVSVAGDAPDSITVSGTVASDHDPVPANDSTTDTVRVISFSGNDFRVDKSVDRPMLRVGEHARFTLVAKNLSEALLSDVFLDDSLARGFSFIPGTAKIVAVYKRSSAPVQGVPTVPAIVSGGLLFSLGNMAGLAEVTVTYDTVVGADAKPGTQMTRVIGSFKSPLGSRIVTAPVQVAVAVTMTAFASEQVVVGRVFYDVNNNGRFDRGEPGLPGVRVLLPTGQAAITDKDGLYNLPAVAAGTTTVTVDAATVPPGYKLRPSTDPRKRGWSRLLRTPLGGGALLHQDFEFVRTKVSPPAAPDRPASQATTSEPLGSADALRSAADPLTRRSPAIGRLEIQADRGDLDAGGRDRTLVTVRAFDVQGEPLKAGLVMLETTDGQWLLPDRPLSDAATAPVSKADVRVKTAAATDPRQYCRPDAPAVELPEALRAGAITIRDGVGLACLQSGLAPVTAELRVAAEDGSGAAARTFVRFQVARRAIVLAAVGEIAIGRGEPATADTPATGNVHGNASVFFQGELARGTQLTFAWTTAESINRAAGIDRRFGLDTNDRVYPVFGDSSTRQELAASNARVYARLDFGRSSILFGDLRGDQARSGRSGLLEVSRTLTGAEVHLERKAGQWLTVQGARPDTAYAREIFPGTSAGFLRLAHGSLLYGSETLTIEVRDRRRPDLVLDRTALARGVDYIVDSQSGIIYLNRPLPLLDQALSLVQVVCSYEYQTTGLSTAVYIARARQDVSSIGLSVRVMGLYESVTGGASRSLGGLEIDQRLPNKGRLHVEWALSHGPGTDGMSVGGTGSAIRAEVEQPLKTGPGAVSLRAGFSRTESRFDNPYGAPATPGSTVGNGELEWQPTASSRVRIAAVGESAHTTAADASRSTISAEWTQKIGKFLELSGGFDARRFHDERSGRRVDSQLVTGVITWRPIDRVELSARREQNLGQADPTYPDQTVLSGRYRISQGAQLFAIQRWSDAPIIPLTGTMAGGVFSPLSTRETAIGIETKLQKLTTVSARYQLDGGINGTDGYAVLGVLSRIPLSPQFSIDGGLDRALRVQGDGKGYTGISGGFTYSPESWRASARYELRTGAQRQQLFSSGVAGQLWPGVTVLAHYRTADYTLNDTKHNLVDALVAMAVRPRNTDNVAFLFSWNYGDQLSQMVANTAASGNRVGRLSADVFFQPASRLELYSRVALLRTDLGEAGTASTYLWQTRAQYAILKRVDLSGEVRWVNSVGTGVHGAVIGAGELAYWIGSAFRVGVGYTTQPWAASGPVLEIRPGRGGFYLVLSSRLSSLFDLFVAAKKPEGGEPPVQR